MARFARRVVPLVLGWATLPTSVSLPRCDPSRAARPLREPVPGLLVELDGGWLLIDAGFNAPLLRDRALHERFFRQPDHRYELVGPPDEDPLEAACALVGVDLRDIVAVAISHFHFDHVGGLRHFAGRAPVYVQRAEYDAAMADPVRAELSAGMFRVDWDDPRVDWRFLDGDAPIADGVDAVLTAGHTPGHQSFVVRLRDADRTTTDRFNTDGSGTGRHGTDGSGTGRYPGYVFACDAADLQENLDDEAPVSAPDGADHEITVAAIRRLKAIAAQHGYRVLPGHDPVVWPAFAAECGVPILG